MTFKEIFKKEEFGQFIRFVVVGFFGVSFTYAIFALLYGLFGVNYAIATSCGFILGVFFVFFINKSFTFRVKDKEKTRSMILKYYGVNLFSLCLGLTVLSFLVEFLSVNPYIANIFVLAITTLSNFFGSKFIVFKK